MKELAVLGISNFSKIKQPLGLGILKQ